MQLSNSVIDTYKGYKLREIHSSKQDKFQISKARPYDDAEYYWGFSYDQKNWTIIYKGQVIDHILGSFREAVDMIENQNKEIEPIMCHN